MRLLILKPLLSLSAPIRQVGLTTNNFAGWSVDLHHGSINIGLADESVQGFSSNRLREALGNTGLATNWLQLP